MYQLLFISVYNPSILQLLHTRFTITRMVSLVWNRPGQIKSSRNIYSIFFFIFITVLLKWSLMGSRSIDHPLRDYRIFSSSPVRYVYWYPGVSTLTLLAPLMPKIDWRRPLPTAGGQDGAGTTTGWALAGVFCFKKYSTCSLVYLVIRWMTLSVMLSTKDVSSMLNISNWLAIMVRTDCLIEGRISLRMEPTIICTEVLEADWTSDWARKEELKNLVVLSGVMQIFMAGIPWILRLAAFHAIPAPEIQ